MNYYIKDGSGNIANNNNQNVSMVTNILPVINSHESPDLPSTNVSLKTLRDRAVRDLFNPNEAISYSNPNISIFSFLGSTNLWAKIEIKKATGHGSADGGIFITPQGGSGQYILTWVLDMYNTQSPGTLKFSIPRCVNPPLFKTNDSWVYTFTIKNVGTAQWRNFDLEILNLNQNSSGTNKLYSVCTKYNNIDVCTSVTNGTYAHPIDGTVVSINNFTSNVGSTTGKIQYLKTVQPGQSITFKYYIKFSGRPKTISFKLKPTLNIPTLLEKERRVPDINSSQKYFENLRINASVDPSSGNSVTDNSIFKIIGYDPAVDTPAQIPGFPPLPIVDSNKYINLFTLTDFVTGASFSFTVRIGTTNSMIESTPFFGWCGAVTSYVYDPYWLPITGVQSDPYIPNSNSKQFFPVITPQDLANGRLSTITLIYPGDDNLYNSTSSIPRW